MKISELVYELAKAKLRFGDIEVVVRGYEGGCNSVCLLEPDRVVWNYNKQWYYGSHEFVREIWPPPPDDTTVQVIKLLGFNTTGEETENEGA